MTQKKNIRIAGIVCAILLLVGMLSIPYAFAASTTPSQAGTQTLTDLTGREVTVPDPVTRVTCLHPIPTYMTWRLAPEKLISIDMVAKTSTAPLLPKSEQTKFLSLPMTGVYFKGLNVEDVIALKPDVVVSMTKDPNVEEEQEKFGIPVATVDKDTIAAYEPSFRFMGQLLGNEKEGDELADYWHDVLQRVADSRSKISEDQQLKVFYANDNFHTTPGKATIMSSIVRDAGGIPYPDVVDLTGDPTNEHIEIPVEDIIKWNPDVIIAANTNVTSQVKTDPSFKNIDAVKNNKVYCVPKYQRTDGLTSLLGLMWVAQTLYPDQFSFDIPKETRDFFEKFYLVTDLTDEEIAMNNG